MTCMKKVIVKLIIATLRVIGHKDYVIQPNCTLFVGFTGKV